MSRYDVLKYSGCLRRLLTTLIVIALSFFGIYVSTQYISIKIFQMIVGAFSSATFFLSLTIIFQDVALFFKILCKKYKIETKKLQGIESKRPFDTFNPADKILVFSSYRIRVEQQFAHDLSIGTPITLVFANKKQYPIIMIKRGPTNG